MKTSSAVAAFPPENAQREKSTESAELTLTFDTKKNPPFAWLVGVLAYQNLAYAEIPGHVAFRWGIVGRYRAYIPLRKVQAVVLRAGPVERVLGLAALTVYVAGGSPTTLNNLPRDEAERVEREVAREAARSQFVW